MTRDPLLAELTALRRQAGMTRRELARRSGVWIGTIERWDAGLRHPNLYNLRLVADVLDVELALKPKETPNVQ